LLSWQQHHLQSLFLHSALTLSKFLHAKIGISSLISSILLSHHLDFSNIFIKSSQNCFLSIIAGLPIMIVTQHYCRPHNLHQ
jgi:hypothetical protein